MVGSELLLSVGAALQSFRARWQGSFRPHRCGNAASVLEISPDGRRFFNVFYAAPENDVSAVG